MLSSIASIAAALLLASSASVHAAPAAIPDIVCDQGSAPRNLTAGDYYYGSNGIQLAYKHYHSDTGIPFYDVVDVNATDSAVIPFTVQRFACNSTALNHFSQPGKFGADTPTKLVTDVVINGNKLCVGVNSGYHEPPSTSLHVNSSVLLVPCESKDDAKLQATQFWSSQFKYDNLRPLIGASSSPSKQDAPTWPLYRGLSEVSIPRYFAVPATEDANGFSGQDYKSFM